MVLWMSADVLGQTVDAALTKKISLSYQDKRFHDVVEDLERVTGLHFIYSSNKIEVNGRVTLSAYHHTLDDVLTQLGKQMHLVFKVQGKYVVIKTLAAVPAISKLVSTAPASAQSSEPAADFSYPPSLIANPSFDTRDVSAATLSYPQVKKDLQTLQVYFDSGVLQKIPSHYIRKIGQRHRLGWFASGGLMMNDYSVGAVFQVGMRSLYFVTSSSWMSDSKYHGAYGLGSSIKLARNFSVNPAITFSPMRETSTHTTNFYGHKIDENVRVKAGQWQMKWMVQYALGRHINLNFGPTFNRLHTSLTRSDVSLSKFTQVAGFIGDAQGFSAYGREPSTQPMVTTVVVMDSHEKHYETLQYWVGWEASVSYRINFSGHR
jgi:hypothetical protein